MHSQQHRDTFYLGSTQQPINQQEQKNKQQIKQLIWSSKKLIKQIQNNSNIKSIKSINSNNSIHVSQGRTLSAKQKIQKSLRNIKNNSTIAEQLLDEDNNQLLNRKQDYMKVIQEVYSKNRRKKRTQNEQSPQNNKSKKKKRSSFIPLSMNIQLQRQVAQRVDVMRSKNYIDQQQSSGQQGRKNKNKNKNKKQLQKLYNQQIQQIQNKIQSNSSIPHQITNKNKNKNKNKNETDENISLRVGSNSNISQKKPKLYDISSSASSQQNNNQDNNDQQDNDEHFRKLQEQIDREINNIKISSTKQVNVNNKIQYKTSVPSSSSSSHRSNKIVKNKAGVISFRQQQNSPKFPRIQVPEQQEPLDTIKQNTYHNDYGINISQNKILQLLNTIGRRIRYSPVVIDEIYYQHSIRQDTNQLQIDNRYSKETKQRTQIINKINNYVTENKKYNRYYCINYSNKYRCRNINNSVLHHRYPFKFDNYGNKKLYYDNRVWRSPGISPSRDKFISLSTPLKDNENWYQSTANETKLINVDRKQRQLLLCRSADTFTKLTSNNSNKMNKRSEKKRLNKTFSQSSSDYSQYYHYKSKSKSKSQNKINLSLLQKKHNQRGIKEDQWDRVREIRRKIVQNQQF